MEKIFHEITGRTEEHLFWSDELQTKIHKKVLKPLLSLKKEAQLNGFELKIASGFRSFSKQEEIWNQKFNGNRPILDKNNRLINPKNLDTKEIVYAILKWSALPGTSRHHWGTDFDFYDGSSIEENYKLQLVPDEYLKGGPFNPLYLWLQEFGRDFGFYFPYTEDRGGVSPEPWHLSFFPQAKKYEKKLTLELFIKNLNNSSLEGKEILFKEAANIFEKYLRNTSSFTL